MYINKGLIKSIKELKDIILENVMEMRHNVLGSFVLNKKTDQGEVER